MRSFGGGKRGQASQAILILPSSPFVIRVASEASRITHAPRDFLQIVRKNLPHRM